MSLSTDLIAQFVKITDDTDKTPKETIAYGEVVIKDNKTYVKLDGTANNVLTPISDDKANSAMVQNGDRVIVTIKNHQAVVTGNLTQPALNEQGVVDLRKLLGEHDVYITDLTTKNATIEEKLTASEIEVAELKAVNVNISGELTAAKGRIDVLESTSINADEIVAIKASVQEFEAVKGTIYNLETTALTAEQADIKYATIGSLDAINATIETLNVDELKANLMNISTLMFGSATGDTIHTNFANSVVQMIGDAQIKSAMIQSVSADKITAGDIITNNVQVKSEDGSLIISDETMQISDGNRVRVQIGKDAANDYSINIWDENGNLMFSKGGITDNAIKDAIIRDDMVSDNANISAGKLNIDSLFTEINGSTHTIKSSRVILDEQNQVLDVAFDNLSTTVGEHTESISSYGTRITAVEGSISSKIWQQDINSSLDNLTVGGRNLLKNTNRIIENATYTLVSFTYGDPSKIVAGEEYTVSFDGMLTDPVQTGFYINTGPAPHPVCVTIPAKATDGTYQHYTATFKMPSNGSYATMNFYSNAPGNGKNAGIKNVKLEIGHKATDWTPAPEDVDTTISTKYSALEQSLDGFKATVADVNGTVTDLSDRYSALELSLDGFKATVSDTYSTKADLNNLEIGGRNLIAKTSFGKAEEYASFLSLGTVIRTDDGLKVTINGTTDTGIIFPLATEGSIEDNQDYTLSFNYRTNLTTGGYIYVLHRTAPNVIIASNITYTPSDTEWQRFELTFSNPGINDRVPHALLLPYYHGTDVWFEIKDNTLKLEKGTKATDWTPAPEDIETRVSSAESNITILSNQISSTVTVDGLESRITQTEKDWTIQLNDHKSEVNNAIDDAIDDIEVGGRNLLRGTAQVYENAAYSIVALNFADRSKIVPGEKYTLSFDGMLSDPVQTGFYINALSTVYPQCIIIPAKATDGKYYHYEGTFTMPNSGSDNNYYAMGFYSNAPGNGKTAGIKNVKLELGTKATDWTAAPEEVEDRILNASATATNYMKLEGSGLVVGNLTAGTLGNNVLIDTDSVDIRNGANVLASFQANLIELGKNGRYTTVIDLCDGGAVMTCTPDMIYDRDYFNIRTEAQLSLYSDQCVYLDTYFENNDLRGTANIRVKSHEPHELGTTVGGDIFIQASTDNPYGFGDGDTSQILLTKDGIELSYDGYLYEGDNHNGFIKLYKTTEGTAATSKIKLQADEIELNGGLLMDGKVMDTGWTNVTPEEPFARYSTDVNSAIRYRRVNKIVDVRGAVKPTQAIDGGTDNYLIFTLPSGYRPSGQICVTCQGSGTNTWLLTITSSGQVRFARYNNGAGYVSAPSGAWLPFNVTFLVD